MKRSNGFVLKPNWRHIHVQIAPANRRQVRLVTASAFAALDDGAINPYIKTQQCLD